MLISQKTFFHTAAQISASDVEQLLFLICIIYFPLFKKFVSLFFFLMDESNEQLIPD